MLTSTVPWTGVMSSERSSCSFLERLLPAMRPLLERCRGQNAARVNVPELAEEERAEARQGGRAVAHRRRLHAERRELLQEVQHVDVNDSRRDDHRFQLRRSGPRFVIGA